MGRNGNGFSKSQEKAKRNGDYLREIGPFENEREELPEDIRVKRLSQYGLSLLKYDEDVKGLLLEEKKEALLSALEKRNAEDYDDDRLTVKEIEEIISQVFRKCSPIAYQGEGLGGQNVFAPITLADFLHGATEKTEFLCEYMLPAGVFALLTGYMKTGKSELLYQLIRSLSHGNKFMGYLASRPLRFLVVACEETKNSVQKKLKGAKKENVFVMHGVSASGEIFIGIESFIFANKIDVITVDTLSTFFNVEDENNNAAMTRALKPLFDISRRTNCSVILVHHDKKSGGVGGRNVRGASSIFALADLCFTLSRTQGGIETNRVLTSLGRYAEVPKELNLNYDEIKGYSVFGSANKTRKESVDETVLASLSEKPLTEKAITEATGLTPKQVEKALSRMIKTEKMVRSGKGKGSLLSVIVPPNHPHGSDGGTKLKKKHKPQSNKVSRRTYR